MLQELRILGLASPIDFQKTKKTIETMYLVVMLRYINDNTKIPSPNIIT